MSSKGSRGHQGRRTRMAPRKTPGTLWSWRSLSAREYSTSFQRIGKEDRDEDCYLIVAPAPSHVPDQSGSGHCICMVARRQQSSRRPQATREVPAPDFIDISSDDEIPEYGPSTPEYSPLTPSEVSTT